ncbi:MAG TPA: helix-turn-helix domain-containing protein [Tepidisphaeraceae bacterium]|jgi:excisionase family DNA binding protein
MSDDERPRLTDAQAADYIGVKKQTLAAWRCTKRQAIPFTRIGRLVRYARADLDRFLAASKVGNSTQLVTA